MRIALLGPKLMVNYGLCTQVVLKMGSTDGQVVRAGVSVT